VQSLAQILWNAGQENHACITLNSHESCFDLSVQQSSKGSYVLDGITEQVNNKSIELLFYYEPLKIYLNYIFLKASVVPIL
jgi:hypothetical protein